MPDHIFQPFNGKARPVRQVQNPVPIFLLKCFLVVEEDVLLLADRGQHRVKEFIRKALDVIPTGQTDRRFVIPRIHSCLEVEDLGGEVFDVFVGPSFFVQENLIMPGRQHNQQI